MAVRCRNRIARLTLGLPAYVLAGALCLMGLMKTTAEMSDQNLWFVYSVLAVLACGVMAWIFNVRKVRPGIADLAAAMFFAWYVACYYINDSIAASKLLETCFYVPLYVSLRMLFSSHRNIGKWLFVVLCVCGIAEAFTGIQQAFGVRYSNHNLFSVTGTFFNPGPYGGYIAVILSLALGYVASRYGYAEKVFHSFRKLKSLRVRNIMWALVFIVAICTVASIVIILPSTMSRAAFVAVGGAAVAIVFANKRVYGPIADYVKKCNVLSVIIGTAAVLVVFGAAFGIYALKKDSADGRLLMWKMAAKVMIENPATGVGPGYFRGAFGDVQVEYFCTGERSDTEIKVAGCPEYGFNEYLQIGAETGIPGLLLFLFLAGAALWRLFRARSYYAFGLLAMLVFAIFSYPFSILPMKILFVIFLAAAGSYSPKWRDSTIMERIITGAALACSIGLATFLTKPCLERIEATKKWQEVRRWYSMEFYSYILEDYPALFPLLKDNPTFLFEYGRSLHMEGHYKESLDVMIPATRLSCDPMYYNVIGNSFKATGAYDKAAEAYLKAYYIIPHRIYPLYLLGKMYSEAGDNENAAQYARQVVDMIPKVESPATQDMQREMKELLDKSERNEE